jgi:hypothetical protein
VVYVTIHAVARELFSSLVLSIVCLLLGLTVELGCGYFLFIS